MSDVGAPWSSTRAGSICISPPAPTTARQFGSMSILQPGPDRSPYVVVLSKDDPSPLAPESDEEKARLRPSRPRSPRTRTSRRRTCPRSDDRPGEHRPAHPGPAAAGPQLHGARSPARRGPCSWWKANGVNTPRRRPAARIDRPQIRSGQSANRRSCSRQCQPRRGQRQRRKDALPPWARKVVPDRDGHGRPSRAKGRCTWTTWKCSVDPRAEWEQIYRETWRIERDFLYDPNAHG